MRICRRCEMNLARSNYSYCKPCTATMMAEYREKYRLARIRVSELVFLARKEAKDLPRKEREIIYPLLSKTLDELASD